MRILLPVLVLVVGLIITPVWAANTKSQANNSNKIENQERQQDRQEEKILEKTGSQKQGSSSATVCDPNANWKNHGEYVSCVAKQKLGGSTVSAAAKSDIGKKKATSSATPSAILTGTPSATPVSTNSGESSTESGSLITEAVESVTSQFSALGEIFGNFLRSFKRLF